MQLREKSRRASAAHGLPVARPRSGFRLPLTAVAIGFVGTLIWTWRDAATNVQSPSAADAASSWTKRVSGAIADLTSGRSGEADAAVASPADTAARPNTGYSVDLPQSVLSTLPPAPVPPPPLPEPPNEEPPASEQPPTFGYERGPIG